MSAGRCTLLIMPGESAEFGDAYWMNREASLHPARVGKAARPVACMAERPLDTTWAGLPRVTSDVKAGDLASAPMPALGLDRAGWWTARYVHPVLKTMTGVRGRCDYLGKLPASEVKIARKVYSRRLHDS